MAGAARLRLALRFTDEFDARQGSQAGAGLSSRGSPGPHADLMQTRPKPDWILISNTTRARVLQQEPGSAMVVLESFVHPAGRGQPSEPLKNARHKECTRFAQELAQYLEHEARQGHFGSLAIFASASFMEELRASLGKMTQRLLSGLYELDLTSVGVAELERRVSHELALAAH